MLSRRHFLRRWFALSCLLMLAGWAEAGAQTPTFSIESVRAAYLLNFMKFADWPDEAGRDALIIGVVGNRDLEDELWKIGKGQKIRGKTVMIRRILALREAGDCDLLYLDPEAMSGNGEFTAAAWLNAAAAGHVLTVSAYPSFLKEGGAISFYTASERLRFEIDAAHAEKVSVRLSSRLLALSRPRGGTDK